MFLNIRLLFHTTYLCEVAFSAPMTLKSKHQSTLGIGKIPSVWTVKYSAKTVLSVLKVNKHTYLSSEQICYCLL